MIKQFKQIRERARKIDDDELLTSAAIVKRGLIVNTQFKPSAFTLYRLIKRGSLKAVNMGNGDQPRFFIKGRDLKEFINKKYKI